MGFAYFKKSAFEEARAEFADILTIHEKSVFQKNKYRKEYIFILRYLGLSLINLNENEEGMGYYT